MREDAESTLFLVSMKALFFCLATSFLLSCVFLFTNSHKNTQREVRNNDTIFVNDTGSDQKNLTTSEVIYEILALDESVVVTINGTQLPQSKREEIKSNKTALNTYFVSNENLFSKSYVYDNNGNILKVEFVLQGGI